MSDPERLSEQELDDIERRLLNHADDTPPREILAAAIRQLRAERDEWWQECDVDVVTTRGLPRACL